MSCIVHVQALACFALSLGFVIMLRYHSQVVVTVLKQQPATGFLLTLTSSISTDGRVPRGR